MGTAQLTLTNVSGAGVTNHPLRFCQPFKQGELYNDPQLVQDGTPIPTDAKVLRRFADGSVMLADLAAMFGSLANNSQKILTFQEQTADQTPLTQAQMLAAGFNFDAKAALTPYFVMGNADYPDSTNAPGANQMFGVDCGTASFSHTSIQVRFTPQTTSATAKHKAVIYTGNSTGVGTGLVQLTGAPVYVSPELVGCTANVESVINISFAFVAGTRYWIFLMGDSAITYTLSANPAGDARGYKCANTYTSGAPTSPTLSTAQPNFRIYARSAAQATVTASARTMLSAGNYTVWSAGPAHTTIVLGDFVNEAHNLSFYGTNSVLPWFVATFWPATNQVEVEFVIECTNSAKLQDAFFDATLTVGDTSPATYFTQSIAANAIVAMHEGNVWAPGSAWINGTPTFMYNLDQNLAYICETGYLPTYMKDEVTIPQSVIDTAYGTGWSTQPIPFGLPVGYLKGMSGPGGREDLAFVPGQVLRWPWTGHWKARALAIAKGRTAGAFNVCYREGAPNKRILRTDTPGTSTGRGKVLSCADRKTLTWGGNTSAIAAGDRLTRIGTGQDFGGWAFETAHNPDPFSVIAMLTGNPWAFEMAYFWAGYLIWYQNGTDRGPSGDYGGLFETGSPRMQAWGLRSLDMTCLIAPDGSLQKEYFRLMATDRLAGIEGLERLDDGRYFTHPVRQNYASRTSAGSPTAVDHDTYDPVCFFHNASIPNRPDPPAGKPWMTNWLTHVIGHMKEAAELGLEPSFLADRLLTNFSVFANGVPNSARPGAVDAYNVNFWQGWTGSGWNPALGGLFLQTFADYMADPYNSVYFADPIFDLPLSVTDGGTDTTGQFRLIHADAVAMTVNEPGGDTAWAWCEANVFTPAMLTLMENHSPQFAMKPRTPPAPPQGPTLFPEEWFPHSWFPETWFPIKDLSADVGQAFFPDPWFPHSWYGETWFPATVSGALSIISNGGGPTASFSVPENTQAIGTVVASGGTGGPYTYGPPTGADASFVTTNPTTGVTRFINPPDFENPQDANGDNVYELTVPADDGSNTTSQDWIVTVTDVTIVISAPSAISINEGTTALFTATKTGGGTPTWSIVAVNDGAFFQIDAVLGTASMIAAPNFEAPQDGNADNVYDFTIQCTDGSEVSTHDCAVTILDVPEAGGGGVLINGGPLRGKLLRSGRLLKS